MVATAPNVTSGLGLRKFQADGFLLTRVYHIIHCGNVFSSFFLFCFPLFSQFVCVQYTRIIQCYYFY